MMYYLYKNEDGSFTVFTDLNAVPGWMQSDIIQVSSLPEGEGILRRAEDGSFYYEPFPSVEEPPIIEQPTEPKSTLEEMQAKTLLNTEVLIAMKNIGV
ncbi:hypothetical protein [Lysinibacillus sphaericus]|uniref:Uncharacterized protein n=1 Tax=Lysinibacillus sphaericus OT4b.31 TaxID=1285586 RepID=R7Z7Q9_LYSSH|nr:hypothetical protein [Lysinibacillus sphaericus]EON70182.1 hypothetical protein H131_22736 [Lysinibacillus sphaericus OT4b.31]